MLSQKLDMQNHQILYILLLFNVQYIKPVYAEDIIREINLSNSQCYDTYDIPVKIIKLSKFIVASQLYYLINYCIIKVYFQMS